MTALHRRTAIVGGLTLLGGGSVAAIGPNEDDGTEATTAERDDGTTTRIGSEEETSVRSDAEDGADSAAARSTLELSVSAPESVSATDGRAEFLLTVRNCGDEAVSVSLALEIGGVTDEFEPLELAPSEDADAYASYAGDSLGAGDHEWTVDVGDRRECGTLSVRE
ncbi:hypothetical protein [Natronococcus occultus]|uniref:CARDB domain-containing protein n=1 Tax=Natronococcus occultus SP4 TaxID=694430 RepID=L0K0R8_9EURY|nr:hypothetical protein [Natronococcus occultus]AGB37718.1 hypothetical protein Natoc_1928 [Natronococcus occultus SP4]